jgi:hypothetical protein
MLNWPHNAHDPCRRYLLCTQSTWDASELPPPLQWQAAAQQLCHEALVFGVGSAPSVQYSVGGEAIGWLPCPPPVLREATSDAQCR